MKKRAAILLISILFITFFSSILVSAQPDPWTAIKDGITPLLQLILGISNGDVGQLLFERFLFALVIVAVVYAVLQRVPIFRDSDFALWTTTIVTAVLGVRFIASANLVETILLSNGVFAIALLSILPFVLYFYFVEVGLRDSRILRRFAWAIYIVIFIGLWWVKSNTPNLATSAATFTWMYFASAGLALISLLIDRTIQRAFTRARMEATANASGMELEVELRRKIAQVNDDLAHGIITADEANKLIRKFQGRLVAIHKNF